jgi:hypothetical protein
VEKVPNEKSAAFFHPREHPSFSAAICGVRALHFTRSSRDTAVQMSRDAENLGEHRGHSETADRVFLILEYHRTVRCRTSECPGKDDSISFRVSVTRIMIFWHASKSTFCGRLFFNLFRAHCDVLLFRRSVAASSKNTFIL